MPDFSHKSTFMAFTLNGMRTGREMDSDFYVAMNAGNEAICVTIPHSPTGRAWHRISDTSLPSPMDFMSFEEAPRVEFECSYRIESKSCLMLISNR
jgi:hypothetical protein